MTEKDVRKLPVIVSKNLFRKLDINAKRCTRGVIDFSLLL